MRSHSLRTRLVAMVLLLLAIASAVVAVVTTLTLRQFLLDRLDDNLRSVSQFTRFAPSPTERGPFENGPPLFDAMNATIADGRVVRAWVVNRDTGAKPLPESTFAQLMALPADGRPRSVDLSGLGGYRLLATPSPVGDTVDVAGLAEQDVEDTVARLVTTELLVALVALLGAGLTGAVLVRRELRPLERVAGTAARVSALPLDRGEVSLVERVPDVDPHTEVGQVGAALNRMLDHVGSALEVRQASETQLRQFVADASHELRTPLAAIRGYAELTRRTPLPAETVYSLSRISSQAERMSALVEDLLLLARLDAGRPLERAEVDLTRLVLDGVSDAHAAGPEHRWRLDLPDEPVVVSGDASRLAQVLANLLANARTHTPAGTSVTVTLTLVPGAARISVLDAGPGIAPDLRPHVFERFARGSTSRSREHGSTGLGLSIVDAVVAAHRGSVSVMSRPGRTEFTVHLPTGADRPTGAAVEPTPTGARTAIRPAATHPVPSTLPDRP